jgi:hypothetical protein
MAAFPATIWEQDEAVFAGAVVHFDPTDNLPHPPWFPLWIAAGKAVHLFGTDPITSLQLLSFAFSVWILFPLTALWSAVLPRKLAAPSAVVFLVAPGPWFFSGRAFSGTAATALLVAALAFWMQAGDRPRWTTAGALMAALAVLVRPHFLPAVVGAMLILGVRASTERRRSLLAFVVPLLAGTTLLVIASGGPFALWPALETHADYHFSRLDDAEHGFTTSGFSRCLGHPAVAVAWLAMGILGLIRLARDRRLTLVSPVVVGALLPLLVVIHGLSNPGHARYAVPLLALSCGLAALGLDTLFHRWTPALIGSIVVLAAASIAPQLATYRSAISPPVAAVDEAFLAAARIDGIVVADRTLHAFVVLHQLTRPSPAPVLFDHMLELGHAPPAAQRTVAVFDRANGSPMNAPVRERTFTCSIPLVRTLGQDRYLDLGVAAGARFRGQSKGEGSNEFGPGRSSSRNPASTQ